jgi:ribosomal protein S18 acetylase RimI-like enzyme/catechol 2,3-dioxygenase-like lactoylglutathione lyase family enzyme
VYFLSLFQASTVIEETRIQRGFADAHRHTVAQLYDAAFGSKLALAIPEEKERLAVLAAGFDPQFALLAWRGDVVLGVAGFKTERGAFTGALCWRLLRAKLGLWGAVRAMLVLSLFEREAAPNQLLMDGIAVAPSARGGGLGRGLLSALAKHAAEHGYQSIRLDVIDTNPGARRLYERMGFVAWRTERFEYLRWLLGFSAATQMVLPITRSEVPQIAASTDAQYWNPLVPELTVRCLEASLSFYTAVGFRVRFQRESPPFAYLELGQAQLMLEQEHAEGWCVAELERPLGRGVNFQIEVAAIQPLLTALQNLGVQPFQAPEESWYRVSASIEEGQQELLVQDPDGYLLRFVQPLGARRIGRA